VIGGKCIAGEILDGRCESHRYSVDRASGCTGVNRAVEKLGGTAVVVSTLTEPMTGAPLASVTLKLVLDTDLASIASLKNALICAASAMSTSVRLD
jgi:hypothetical protein